MTTWSYGLLGTSTWTYSTDGLPVINGSETALPTSVSDTGEEHCLALKPDVVSDGQALLLYQFKDATKLNALLAIYLRQLQEAEVANWLLLNLQDIDIAGGIYLDHMGALIGQPRSGLDDTFYRNLLKARIAANKSTGTSADIIDVIQALFGNEGVLSEDYPAKVVYDTGGAVVEYALESVFQVLRDSVASGIQFMFIYQEYPDDEIFTFAPGNVVVVDADQGFANTAQTTGGRLRNARVA